MPESLGTKVMHVAGDVAKGGFQGYMTGRMIGQGVGAAHRAAQRIPAYARASQASVVGQYYGGQMPRDAPGAHTAAFYQYRYGLPGNLGESAGTPTQMSLLQEQRAVQTHLDNLTRAPRRAAWHNESPYVPEDYNQYPGSDVSIARAID